MIEIQKPYYNSALDPLGQFVVNGEVSTDYIEAVQSQLRRQALRYAGQEAIRGLGHASALVGKAIVNGLDQLVTSAQYQ
jgi:hypothetical protein